MTLAHHSNGTDWNSQFCLASLSLHPDAHAPHFCGHDSRDHANNDAPHERERHQLPKHRVL